MRTAILIVGLAVAVLLVIFGVQNTQPVYISFLGLTSGGISLSLVIVMSAVVGAVLATMVSLWDRMQRGWAHRRDVDPAATRAAQLEARVSELERENAELRAARPDLPVEPLRSRELGGADQV
jgi:uncharacterized integral membrane protein